MIIITFIHWSLWLQETIIAFISQCFPDLKTQTHRTRERWTSPASRIIFQWTWEIVLKDAKMTVISKLGTTERDTKMKLKHSWVIHQGSLVSEANKVQSCNNYTYIFLTGEARIKSLAGSFPITWLHNWLRRNNALACRFTHWRAKLVCYFILKAAAR